MHQHVEPLGLLEHRLEAAWPFDARDLDTILRAVREPLRRVREVVQVAPRQADRLQERPRLVHGARSVLPGARLRRREHELAEVESARHPVVRGLGLGQRADAVDHRAPAAIFNHPQQRSEVAA